MEVTTGIITLQMVFSKYWQSFSNNLSKTGNDRNYSRISEHGIFNQILNEISQIEIY